jgi:putative ABC transport system substrate-binding protein
LAPREPADPDLLHDLGLSHVADDEGGAQERASDAGADAAARVVELMDRRRFLLTSLAGAMPGPPAAEAQRAEKMYRVGILSTGNPRSAAIFQALELRLREAGYIEGQNLAIEFRYAEGRTERLSALAAELVRLNVDVVVVATDAGTRAVRNASAKIPIVIVSVNYDPVALGYIKSLARPGTNVTGVLFLHRELTAKRFELFKEILPTVKRVSVLTDPHGIEQLQALEAANRSMGLTLQVLEQGKPSYDFEGAFRLAMGARADALFVLTTPIIFRERAKISQLALKDRLPTSFAHREHVDAGGLMSYGPNFEEMWRLAAIFVDKILKGAHPGELPVQQPTKFELVINLKTAKALGLTIPPSLLARADQVIE